MATDWEEYRKRIIGLGDTSTRKSYYPDLQEKIKALEESQENIVSIYNAVSDGIVVHAVNGEVVSLNNRAKSIFNLCDTGDNFIESKFNLLSVVDNPNKLTIGFSKAAKGGTSILELNVIANSKTYEIPVQFSTNRISWNEQEMLISIIRDFSSRKKYEKKLIEARENAENNEERFRMLFNNMNSAFAYHKIITNKKGEPMNYEFIEVNSQFEKITGLKAEDVVGNNVLDLFPDLESIWIEKYGQVALKGESIEYTDYVKELGKYFSAKAYCPKIGYFAVTFTDVTDEIKSKEALRISEERYNLALEAVNDGVWDWHIPSGKTYFDARYFTISGYKPNEFTHDFSEWEKRIHPDDLSKAKEAIQSQLSIGSQGFDIEFRFKRKEGEWMWIRGRGKVVERDVKGSPIRMVGTHTDITDKKLIEQELVDYKNNLEFVVQERTEELEATNEELTSINEELLDKRNELEAALDKLKDAQNQLVLSEKMASLGVLTSGIAHEINNPINFISSGVIGLEMEVNQVVSAYKDYLKCCQKHDNPLFTKLKTDIEEQYNVKKSISNIPKLINSIQTGVSRTISIIKGLRTFSRLDEESKTEASLSDLIKSTLTILYNKYKNRIDVKTELAPNDTIICYPGKMGQVFLNILVNSIQAIKDEGEILIKTKFDSNKEMYKISIIDNGEGMPNDIQQRIFDPFFTTKPVGEGTGLGLSIVHGIVNDHNGRIKVKSEVGNGTEILLYLPKR